MLTTAEYLDVLRVEGDSFATSIQAALDKKVVGCEPWLGSDLLWHMVEVHYSWKFTVESELSNPDDYVAQAMPNDEDMLATYVSGLDGLLHVLSTTDPSRSCWTWAGTQDVDWVIRRMAHETAIHAWDARRAAGQSREIDARLASDGIDEFMFLMLRYPKDGQEALDGSVHVHCTDVDGEWLVVPETDGQLHITREHAKGACAIRGTAQDILLALWRRTSMSSLEIIGDEHVATQFLNRAANN